jgi:prolyl oligopeptidase
MATPQYPALPKPLSDYSRPIGSRGVADPYHELENHSDPAVHAWALAQDAVAGDFLHANTMAQAFEHWLRSHTGPIAPVWRAQRGVQSFYFKMVSGKEQPLLYLKDDGAAERCILDLNDSGEVVQPLLTDVSPSGRYLKYCSAPMGEPMAFWQVFDLHSNELVERSSFAAIEPKLAWLADESAYYYCVCRELFVAGTSPADGVYRHSLGASWAADVCVYAYPGTQWQGHIAMPYMAPNQSCLIVHTGQFSSGNSGLLLLDLDAQGMCVDHAARQFIDDAGCFNQIVGLAGKSLFLHTCLDAPNGQLVAIDLTQPGRSHWRVIVPEQSLALAKPEQFISPAKSSLVNGQLYLCYVKNAHDVIHRYSIEGELLEDLSLPELSTVDAVYSVEGDTVIFSQSFLRPRAAWACREQGPQLLDDLSYPLTVPGITIEQQFYGAADGTKIPIYLMQRAGDAPWSARPTLLYAYGGFGQTIAPEFTAEAALWLAQGGVYALANIRGGGEYGEAWHEAARAGRRQTAFDDFYAAAEYLIDQGYTDSARLVIKGISNGGLLSAVALNQRPELFAAVVSEVPLVDMFWMAGSSIGGALSAEYGNPAAEADVFAAMSNYSPLQNVRAGADNPPQLVVVAEKDPSAQPGQIYKYLAARQALADTPVLLRIIYGEGHTHWPWAVNCRNLAEQVAFLLHCVKPAE